MNFFEWGQEIKELFSGNNSIVRCHLVDLWNNIILKWQHLFHVTILMSYFPIILQIQHDRHEFRAKFVDYYWATGQRPTCLMRGVPLLLCADNSDSLVKDSASGHLFGRFWLRDVLHSKYFLNDPYTMKFCKLEKQYFYPTDKSPLRGTRL